MSPVAATNANSRILNPSIRVEDARNGKDVSMVKGEFFRWLRERLHLSGIAPRAELSTHDMGQEGDADSVSTWIAVRIGEDPNQPIDFHSETRLFLDLAAYRLLRRLAHLPETAWQRPRALEGRVPPPHEYHGSILKDDYRVDG